MQTVISANAMRMSDAYTIEKFISSKDLMFKAGQAIFENGGWNGRVAIVCGSGNNAGDGYVLALLLAQAGIYCKLFLISNKFSEEGKYYHEKCISAGIESELCDTHTNFEGFNQIADCIFGTGFTGSITGLTAVIIDKINNSQAEVISVDINSGLNADTGMTDLCVISDLTISIGYYKTGHFLSMAKDKIKRLVNCNIGIELVPDCNGVYSLLEKDDFGTVLKPRNHYSHKGTYGYVGVMGGCTEYSGAVKLANLSCAALRAGGGVSKVIAAASTVGSITPYLLDSTISKIPDRDGHMLFDTKAIDNALEHLSALSIGMGWGESEENSKILEHILLHYAINVVIDADGLNTLAGMGNGILKETPCRIALTPHFKEFSRISGLDLEEIVREPIGAAVGYARKHHICLLLKGTTTIVTDGYTTYLVDRGCPGMATAGSGDVLSGILTGLLGSCDCTPLTVACGAYIAGLAGELAEEEVNPISMTSSDTIKYIPLAISKMLGK